MVRKFFLHVSKAEQKKRFLARLNEPEKNWKFSANDVKERAHWDEYQDAYEDMIRHTATKDAPWYVVPADNKWFTRLVVASAIIETLQSLEASLSQSLWLHASMSSSPPSGTSAARSWLTHAADVSVSESDDIAVSMANGHF